MSHLKGFNQIKSNFIDKAPFTHKNAAQFSSVSRLVTLTARRSERVPVLHRPGVSCGDDGEKGCGDEDDDNSNAINKSAVSAALLATALRTPLIGFGLYCRPFPRRRCYQITPVMCGHNPRAAAAAKDATLVLNFLSGLPVHVSRTRQGDLTREK